MSQGPMSQGAVSKEAVSQGPSTGYDVTHAFCHHDPEPAPTSIKTTCQLKLLHSKVFARCFFTDL